MTDYSNNSKTSCESDFTSSMQWPLELSEYLKLDDDQWPDDHSFISDSHVYYDQSSSINQSQFEGSSTYSTASKHLIKYVINLFSGIYIHSSIHT